VFGGVRCVTGEDDFDALRRDDFLQLPLLAAEVPAARSGPAHDQEVLLLLDGRRPLSLPAPVVELDEVGTLCTERPVALTVWAGAGSWARAMGLLAMMKSAHPERCLVLTDRLPPLDLVPSDGRVAAMQGGGIGPIHAGSAGFTCGELRSERVFRLLLDGRARGRSDLRALLDLHALALTPHGRQVLARWSEVLPVLFAEGPIGTMPDALRADLEELKQAALDCEHAITGGFHALDSLVRMPADWEAGAARYLPLAASHSPTAAAEVERWLRAEAGWHRASAAQRERLRRTAARALHRLVDDPWLGERQAADLFPSGSGQ
jgi:hypothetical protein